jgi:hypothetical protein
MPLPPDRDPYAPMKDLAWRAIAEIDAVSGRRTG